MLQDPNVERYVKEALKPLLKQIKELQIEVETLKKEQGKKVKKRIKVTEPLELERDCNPSNWAENMTSFT